VTADLKIEPMAHTGDSANLAFYAPHSKPPGYVWAEVCRNDVMRGAPGAGLVRRPVPTFSFTVYKHGTGELARFTYEPKTRPPDGPLSCRTVTRLIRDRMVPR
jgi:hypothetical protein